MERFEKYSPEMKEFRAKVCSACHFVDRLALADGLPCCTCPVLMEIDLESMKCSKFRKA